MMSPVPILLYHSISADPPDWIATFTVSPVTFRTHLDVVVASGRQPITVSQFTDGLQGKAELPARPVLITVDDGFADFADNAIARSHRKEVAEHALRYDGRARRRSTGKCPSTSRYAAGRRSSRP